jgi:putative spermidine/putrescine transport system permease protein
MFFSLDAGFRAIDVHTLTEASQSLGAKWTTTLFRVILPNIKAAALAASFLTLAIVMGEFTMANYLARPAFAPYLYILGSNEPYQQSAVALVSFGLTWIAMGFIALLGRSSRSKITVTGAR